MGLTEVVAVEEDGEDVDAVGRDGAGGAGRGAVARHLPVRRPGRHRQREEQRVTQTQVAGVYLSGKQEEFAVKL